jgi:hypothetical protein
MSIIDLRNVELLQDFLVDVNFSVFESWNDGFAKVDGDNIVQNLQALDFFVRLYTHR